MTTQENQSKAAPKAALPLHTRRKAEFVALMEEWGIPSFCSEYKFWKDRNWKFDYAFPEFKVAVEFEGGSWTGGRHTTGTGFQKDAEKYNHAASEGWLVLRATTTVIMTGDFHVLLFDALVLSGAIVDVVEDGD